MKKLVVLGLVALTLTGCGKVREGLNFGKGREVFDGQHFRGKSSSERSNRHRFVATVSPVSASVDGAIEAGRYHGVRHCIKYFGTSDIDWEVGPDTAREALVIENDTLTFVGECRE